ncbi:MAG: methyltransferase domain-containing protein [Anaerolineae bacterium]|nr:methyltransferase domain-containing protein [Anaerolineae bacterium]
MPWNPDQYHKFREQRAAPFEDLVKLITIHDNLSVMDLGCGTGELTAKLAAMLPNSHVVGLDSSAQMLEKAAAYAGPNLSFEQGDLATVEGQWDVVFSHAAIQWVDDHAHLIPQLFGLVKPGGQLVVQQPSNHNHPTHAIVREMAIEEPYRTALGGYVRFSPVLGIEAYADLLYQCGAEDITVFEKVYPHVMDNSDAMVEWTKGTLLIPYLERLPDALRETFLDDYRARLRPLFPTSPVFYGFRRILFAAARPA